MCVCVCVCVCGSDPAGSFLVTYCPVELALITHAQRGTGGRRKEVRTGRKRERIDEKRERRIKVARRKCTDKETSEK